MLLPSEPTVGTSLLSVCLSVCLCNSGCLRTQSVDQAGLYRDLPVSAPGVLVLKAQQKDFFFLLVYSSSAIVRN